MDDDTSPLAIALGSDEATPLTDALLRRITDRGDAVELFGAVAGGGRPGPRSRTRSALPAYATDARVSRSSAAGPAPA